MPIKPMNHEVRVLQSENADNVSADMYDRVFLISASPIHPPQVRVGAEVDIFHPHIRTRIIRDARTGLLAAYNENESVVFGDQHFITGRFILFQSGKQGQPISVTPQEYLDTIEAYLASTGKLTIGSFTVDAVRICSA